MSVSHHCKVRYSVGIFLQNHFCIKELIDKCNAEAWSECVNYASIWRFGQQSEKDVIIDLLLEKQKILVPSMLFGWSTDRPLLHMCVICHVWWINGTVADLSFTNELCFWTVIRAHGKGLYYVRCFHFLCQWLSVREWVKGIFRVASYMHFGIILSITKITKQIWLLTMEINKANIWRF